MTDRTVADLTGNILAGLLAGDPTLPEAAAIDKAIRMARDTLAALEGVPIDPTPPTARTVLTLDDFTYLGWAGLPLDEPGVTRFGFSTGAPADDDLWDAIEAAENLSFDICEQCGSVASDIETASRRTLCNACWNTQLKEA